MISSNLQLVTWNITSQCPLKCKHCYISGGESQIGELSTSEAKMFIDDLSSMGDIMLVFAGGEPQTRPDFYELLSYANIKGLFTIISTSGVLIDPKSAEAIRSAGTQWVAVSLDSDSPQIHDGLRGVSGVFDKAVKAIRTLRKAKVNILIHMTIFRGNWRLIDRMVKFVEELGAAAIHFIFVVKEGRAKEADGLELKPFEFEKALLELYHLTKDGLPIMVKPRCAPQYWRVAFQRNEDASFLQQVSKGIVTRGCSAGTGVANINPDGTVTPCAFWHMSVGNIRESKFSEVWYKSPVFLQLRNIEFLKGKCGLCEYKEVCGGCRERAYTNSGDFLAEDPSCVYRPKLCRDWNRS